MSHPSQYYFNPEDVRFRSRAEAVRYYGLTPIAAPRGGSKGAKPGAKAFGSSFGKPKPYQPREPKVEPYVPVPDVIPRADAARTARLNSRQAGALHGHGGCRGVIPR